MIDEAYHEYVDRDDYPDAIAEHAGSRPNVAVLRTFSKIFGLAGLRIGYMVAAPAVVDAVSRCRHWFDVSDLAHVAAAASLDDEGEIARRREETAAGRSAVAQLLRRRRLSAAAVVRQLRLHRAAGRRPPTWPTDWRPRACWCDRWRRSGRRRGCG